MIFGALLKRKRTTPIEINKAETPAIQAGVSLVSAELETFPPQSVLGDRSFAVGGSTGDIDNSQTYIIISKSEQTNQKPRNRFMYSVNDEYVELFKFSGESDTTITEAYFNINSDPKIIAQVVCSDEHYTTDDYRNIQNQIFELARDHDSRFPLLITSDGGNGKSTLLHSLALHIYSQKKKCIIFDFATSKKIETTDIIKALDKILDDSEDLYLCADNVFSNVDLLYNIYQRKNEPSTRHKYNSLKIIICERAERIYQLFDSDYILWKKAKLFYLPTTEAVDINGKFDNDGLFSFFNRANFVVCPWTIDFKKSVLHRICDSVSREYQLDNGTVENSLNKMDNFNKGIASLFQDFKREYNSLAKTINASGFKTISTLKNDWEVWEERFKDSNESLKNAFPYIAVLRLFDIHASFSFLSSITGLTNVGVEKEILDKLSKGMMEPAIVSDTGVRFKHDTVADNYFEEINNPKPIKYLLELLDEKNLDNETVIAIEKKVLSMKYVTGRSASIFTMQELMLICNCINSKQSYIDLLMKKKRLYSFRFAYIFLEATINKNESIVLINNIDTIFLQLSSQMDFRSGIDLWVKCVVQIISLYSTNLPKALFDHISSETYRAISSYLKNVKLLMSRLDDSKQWKSFNLLCIDIYEKIVKDIDSNDKVSLIELSAIYKKEHRYSDALYCLTILLELSPKQEKIKTYNHIINLLIDEYKYKKRNIYLTPEELSGQKVIDACKEYILIYPGKGQLICPYARFLKDLRRYGEAESVLCSLPDTSFSKHKELGMLYSSRPLREETTNINPIFNLEKAIVEYEKALSIMDINSNIKTKKSILIPLAMAYLHNNDLVNSRRICMDVKRIDKREKKIPKLLEQIDDREKQNLSLLSSFATTRSDEVADEHVHYTKKQFREKIRKNSNSNI